MLGNIIGGGLDQITSSQLKVRQTVAAAGYGDNYIQRTPEIINYLNNRNAWIKFASGVNIGGQYASEKIKNIFEDSGITINTDDTSKLGLNGSNLAQQFVLFNGTSTINADSNWDFRSGVATSNNYRDTFGASALYGGIGQDRGLQPGPGVKNLKIKTLNRGSIRKATITIKCYNKLQFNIIEALYLRLGYNMLVEWGYDKYVARLPDLDKNPQNTIDNNNPSFRLIEDVKDTLVETGFFQAGFKNDDVYSSIESLRSQYAGNYDGFYGKVQNFSWKINTDLTYDITIDLVTIGSLIASLKSNIPAAISSANITDLSQNLGNIVDLNEYEASKKQEYIDQDAAKFIAPEIGTDAISIYLNSKKVNFNSLKDEEDYLYITEIIGGSGDVITSNSAATNTAIQNISNRLYETISTGFQQARFNLEKTKTNRYFIRFGRFLDDYFDLVNLYIVKNNQKSDKNQPIINWLQTDDTYCNYSADMVPFDPRVLYFKPVFSEITKQNCFTSGVSSADKLANSAVADFTTTKKNVLLGQVMNMYLNIDFLLKELGKNVDKKGNISTFIYIQNVLNGINKAMANQTQLELFVDNDKDVKIIELNTPKGITKLTPKNDFIFEAYGYGVNNNQASIIQNFNIKTKITPDLINLISIGATSPESQTNGVKALSFNNFNRGLINRFEPSYDQPPIEVGPVSVETKLDTQESSILAAFRNTFKNDIATRKSNSSHSNYDRGMDSNTNKTKGRFYWGYTWGDGMVGIAQGGNSSGIPQFDITWESPSGGTLKLEFKGNNIPGGYAIDDKGYNKYYLHWGKNLNNAEYWIGESAGRWKGEIKGKILKETKKYLASLAGTEVRFNTDPANYQEYLTEAFGGDFNYNIDTADTSQGDVQNVAVVEQRQVSISNAKWFEINPSFINQGISLYKLNRAEQDVVDYKKNGVVSNSTGFIPIESSFDLDGISTFKIFQKINVSQNFLPNNYPSTLSFIIKNIDHTLKDNAWTTSLTTVSIPIQEKESNIKSSDLNQKPWPQGNTKQEISKEGCSYPPAPGFPTVAFDDPSISLINPCSNTGLVIKNSVQPNKKIIVIHHTASNGSSADYVRGWIRKTYAIATHFIIERNPNAGKNGAVRLFEDKYWSNHIGKTPGESAATGDPDQQEPYMLSIEIDSYGYLTKTSTGYKQGSKKWKNNEIAVARPVRYKKNTTNLDKLLRQAETNIVKAWQIFWTNYASEGNKFPSSISDFTIGKNGEPYIKGLGFPFKYNHLGYKKNTLVSLGYVKNVLFGTSTNSTTAWINNSASPYDINMFKGKNKNVYRFGINLDQKVFGIDRINYSKPDQFFSQYNNRNKKNFIIKTYDFNGQKYKMDGFSAWIVFASAYAILKDIQKGKDYHKGINRYIKEEDYNKLLNSSSSWQVITYKQYSYFQKYTSKQVKATCDVVKDWAIKYKIPVCPIKYGTKVWDDWYQTFFGCDLNGKAKVDYSAFRSDSQMAKACYTHNTYKSTKVDIFPQKELIEGLRRVAVKINTMGIIYPGDKNLSG